MQTMQIPFKFVLIILVACGATTMADLKHRFLITHDSGQAQPPELFQAGVSHARTAQSADLMLLQGDFAPHHATQRVQRRAAQHTDLMLLQGDFAPHHVTQRVRRRTAQRADLMLLQGDFTPHRATQRVRPLLEKNRQDPALVLQGDVASVAERQARRHSHEALTDTQRVSPLLEKNRQDPALVLQGDVASVAERQARRHSHDALTDTQRVRPLLEKNRQDPALVLQGDVASVAERQARRHSHDAPTGTQSVSRGIVSDSWRKFGSGWGNGALALEQSAAAGIPAGWVRLKDTRIDVVRHRKEKSGGYVKGSPLYSKQQVRPAEPSVWILGALK